MILYLTNSASTVVTTSKTLSSSFGTAISTSTTVAPTTNKTLQFIPGTAANNTAFTPVANTFNSKGWIFDKQLTGRFYPGNFVLNLTVNNSAASTTGEFVAQIGIVSVSGNVVSLFGGEGSGLINSSAVALTAGAQTFTITMNSGGFVELNPNQRLYVELYFISSARFLTTVTTGLTLDSASTTVTTPFFKASMQSVDSNSVFQLLGF